ncbi:hypothetical protein ACVWZZ_007579 [Bradyrhizobium sp. LM6.10]
MFKRGSHSSFRRHQSYGHFDGALAGAGSLREGNGSE